MGSKQVERYRQMANLYFDNEGNKPYSILEVCTLLEISYQTLKRWEKSKSKDYSTLAHFIIGNVAACWEKGGLPVGLSTYLHKLYLSEESAPIIDDIQVNLVVEQDEDRV